MEKPRVRLSFPPPPSIPFILSPHTGPIAFKRSFTTSKMAPYLSGVIGLAKFLIEICGVSGFGINLRGTTPEIRNVLLDPHSENLGAGYLNMTV